MKQAAARANRRLGHLGAEKADAIDRACDRIVKEGALHDQFVVDAFQAGAGTSTNMNANEVVANVALEIMGKAEGRLRPSTPTTTQHGPVDQRRLSDGAAPRDHLRRSPADRALDELAFAFKAKAVEFADVIKIGRTQLQDAVPMTLGQEFDAFSPP